jgi:hypothetical protein
LTGPWGHKKAQWGLKFIGKIWKKHEKTMVLQPPPNGVPMKSAEKKKMEFHWVRWVSGHLFDFDIKEVQALLTDRKPPTA